MTLQQILNAEPIVAKLIELKLPVKKAYKVYSLAKVINEKRDFFINEERKLIELYHAKVSPTGQVAFQNDEDRIGFIQDHANLSNCEVDDAEVLELSFDELGDIELSPRDIAMLEGVINFID